MTAMVQAQSLRGYRELVTDLGGNRNRLLRKAWYRAGRLNQLTAFIGFETLIELLERWAADLGCLISGCAWPNSKTSAFWALCQWPCATPPPWGRPWECASKYFHIYNAAVAFTIDTGERRGQARFVFRVLPGHYLRWAQAAEHGVGLTWRILTLLSEGRSRGWRKRRPGRGCRSQRAGASL